MDEPREAGTDAAGRPAADQGPEPPRGRGGPVRLRGLTRRFGDLLAVDDLAFDVAPGELFGLVGPDGAGKTTTLRMLAGVLRPSAGDAHVDGVSVVEDPEGVKPHIAYMSQRFGLYEDLSVAENLAFYADLYRVPKQARPARFERLYAFSRLGEFQDRLAGALSGGMKQKLGLSCALVHQPRVLLLDEPTFGVDPISRRELWLILHEMVDDGVTVIVSTSYLDEAERCDRVALLHRGRVVALDTPSALQGSLTGTTVSVRSDDPRRTRDVLRGLHVVDGASLFGDAVHAFLTPGGDAGSLRRALADRGVDAAVEVVEPSLEDVFIRRVAGPSGVDAAEAAGPGADR